MRPSHVKIWQEFPLLNWKPQLKSIKKEVDKCNTMPSTISRIERGHHMRAHVRSTVVAFFRAYRYLGMWAFLVTLVTYVNLILIHLVSYAFTFTSLATTHCCAQPRASRAARVSLRYFCEAARSPGASSKHPQPLATSIVGVFCRGTPLRSSLPLRHAG